MTWRPTRDQSAVREKPSVLAMLSVVHCQENGDGTPKVVSEPDPR